MKNKAIRLIGKALKDLARTSLASPSRTGFFQPDVRELKKRVKG